MKITLELTAEQLTDLTSQIQDANEFPSAPETDEKGRAYFDAADPKYRKAHWQWERAKATLGKTLKIGDLSTINANTAQIRKNGWYRIQPRPANSLYIPTLQGQFTHACAIMTDRGGKALDWCTTNMGRPAGDRALRVPANETVYIEVTSNSTTGANNVVFNLL